MKILVLISRLLLGLAFLVAGLNGLHPFMPGAPPSAGFAGAFIGAMIGSHFVFFVSAVQAISGFLLFINRYVPLALALLAPVLANILVFHITMDPRTIPPALVVTVLWIILWSRYRAYFESLFVQHAEMK